MINKIIRGLQKTIYEIIIKERSPQKLAFSCCLGIYIAFSPWVGFHTIMVFVLSWLFRLNATITFASTYLLNNPWTMTPLYLGDYFFGSWVLRSAFGVDAMAINPTWMISFNTKLAYYTGLQGLSFWAFIVGGNLLGIIFSVILYPILLSFFSRITKKSIKSTSQQYENNCKKQKSLP